MRPLACAPPVIASPSSSSRRRRRAYSPTTVPSYMTRMRSESERISSSSSETSRIARPSSRSATRRRWTYSIAPTSRPRVGCAAIEDARVARDLAGDHDLLLVPARERLRAGRAAPPPRMSNSLIRRRRALRSSRRGKSQPCSRVGRLAVVVQREVLGQGELEHEPAPLAVLGDVPDSGVDASPRRQRARRTRWPPTAIVPLAIRRRPVIASTSSVCPFPSTPAIADDLAARAR